jgi:hypothetical protein
MEAIQISYKKELLLMPKYLLYNFDVKYYQINNVLLKYRC